MTPVRHKIPALVGEAAIGERSYPNGRFLPDIKHMDAERRPVPGEFLCFYESSSFHRFVNSGGNGTIGAHA